MPETIAYEREKAVAYARRWAYYRNPSYYDFSLIGGDCTNFASQCVYAGAGVMNETRIYGWYYHSAGERAAAWTGVGYLYRFLVTNEGAGPYAEAVPPDRLEAGDLVQLGRETGEFYHCPVVVENTGGEILVAAHSFDTFGRKLSSYKAPVIRGLHILGVRKG